VDQGSLLYIPFIGHIPHHGPELCDWGSNAMSEALTGVRAGRVLSRESVRVQGAHVVDVTEGPSA